MFTPLSTAFPHPFISQYRNGSWSFPITAQNPPPGFDLTGQFNAASCSGSICIATGTYDDIDSHSFPVIAQTTNGGSSWTYAIDGTNGLQPPDYTSTAQFNSTNCENNVCIAVGSYMVGQATYPMYAQSTNGGAWTYVIDDNSATLPPGFNNHGVFSGAGGIGTATFNSKHKAAKHIRKK